MTQHVAPVKLYVAVFGALMLLTALTVGASYVNIGQHLPEGWPKHLQ
jgi:hypothetical protein